MQPTNENLGCALLSLIRNSTRPEKVEREQARVFSAGLIRPINILEMQTVVSSLLVTAVLIGYVEFPWFAVSAFATNVQKHFSPAVKA